MKTDRDGSLRSSLKVKKQVRHGSPSLEVKGRRLYHGPVTSGNAKTTKRTKTFYKFEKIKDKKKKKKKSDEERPEVS